MSKSRALTLLALILALTACLPEPPDDLAEEITDEYVEPTATLAPTVEPHRVIDAHPADAYPEISWSPDSRLIASGGNDDTVRIWDAGTLALVQEITHPEMIFSRFSEFSPDGRTLMLSQGWHGAPAEGGGIPVYFDVAVWDWQANERLDVFSVDDSSGVWDVVWSPQGDVLAYWSMGSDQTVYFWAAPGVEAPDPIQRPAFEIGDMVWLPDGTLVGVGPAENGVGLWRSTSPDELDIFEAPWPNYAPATALSPDASLAAYVAGEGQVVVLDLASRAVRYQIPFRRLYVGGSSSLAFNPDASLLAVSGVDNVTLWDVATGGLTAYLPLHSEEAQSYFVSFSPDGNTLAATSEGAIHLWDVSAYLEPPATVTPVPTTTPLPQANLSPEVATITAPMPPAAEELFPSVTHVRWLDSNALRLIGQAYNQRQGVLTALWQTDVALAGGEEPHITELPVDTPPGFDQIDSPDGSRFAAWVHGSEVGQSRVIVVDAETHEVTFTIQPGELGGEGNEIAWSPDGTRIAIQTFTGIPVYDVENGVRLGMLEDVIQFELEGYMDVEWSPDGRYIAAYLTGGDIGAKAVVWDAETFATHYLLEEAADHPDTYEYGMIDQVLWSPDGSRLLLRRSTRADILDVDSLQIRSAIPVRGADRVVYVGIPSWSPDGVYILQIGDVLINNGPYVITSLNTLTGETDILIEFPEGTDDWTPGVFAWHPDQPWVAAVGPDRRITLINAETLAALDLGQPFEYHPIFLGWSPDGARLAAVSYDGMIQVWTFE